MMLHLAASGAGIFYHFLHIHAPTLDPELETCEFDINQVETSQWKTEYSKFVSRWSKRDEPGVHGFDVL
jgi:hypothetical protein